VSLFGIVVLWANIVWKPTPGYAEIYKYVKDGVVHYTNRHPQQKAYEILRDDSSSSLSVRTVKVKQGPSSKEISYVNIIHRVATAYQLSPELVKAIVKVESNYNKSAVSPKGAQGLMQLMPTTVERFGVSDVFDPEENITGGVKFLRHLFDEFGEDHLELVLAGYNAGEEAVRKHGNQIPPYAETQQYVKDVVTLYLPGSKSPKTRNSSIYKYVGTNGVLVLTNIPRVN
jgi:soluble lytic murein transglycosylase-like protein